MGEGLACGETYGRRNRIDCREARRYAYREMGDHKMGPRDQETQEDLRISRRAARGRHSDRAQASAQPRRGCTDRRQRQRPSAVQIHHAHPARVKVRIPERPSRDRGAVLRPSPRSG